MKKSFLRIYQSEVAHQCKYALMATQNIKYALERYPRTKDASIVWYSVQSFLIAVGNISKLLWPSTSSKKRLIPERYAELRKSLSVDKKSPLKYMKFRNYFEHYDEHLDIWVKKSKRHNLIDSFIGDPDKSKGFELGDYHRFFDTTNYVITFRGDKYKLKPIIKAVKDLWQKAVIEIRKNPWEDIKV